MKDIKYRKRKRVESHLENELDEDTIISSENRLERLKKKRIILDDGEEIIPSPSKLKKNKRKKKTKQSRKARNRNPITLILHAFRLIILTEIFVSIMLILHAVV